MKEHEGGVGTCSNGPVTSAPGRTSQKGPLFLTELPSTSSPARRRDSSSFARLLALRRPSLSSFLSPSNDPDKAPTHPLLLPPRTRVAELYLESDQSPEEISDVPGDSLVRILFSHEEHDNKGNENYLLSVHYVLPNSPNAQLGESIPVSLRIFAGTSFLLLLVIVATSFSFTVQVARRRFSV